MKFNKRKSVILCSILSIAFILGGCANKRKSEEESKSSGWFEREQQEELLSLPHQDDESVMRDTFYFKFDSASILEADHLFLDSYASSFLAEDCKDEKIVVYGHTDQVGTRSYNLALGEKRANAIKSYLVKKGVSPSKIEVVSYGFEKPIMPGFTKEACDANRRVQIAKK